MTGWAARGFLCGSALLSTLIHCAGEPETLPEESFAADTDRHLSRLQEFGFAGVVLAAQQGAPIFAKGYGMADRAAATPWTPSTVSTIGSITKQFTGAAILLLQQEGRLRVNDPISKYFDNLPPDKQSVTLHHLLTHSSGITDLRGYGDWDPIEREEFVERSLKQELAFEPGTGYRYSNAGYSLLGAIIEKLSGDSYEAFLRKRLLLPNGLYETGYILPEWGKSRQAQGYQGEQLWGTVLGRPMAKDGPYWVLRANGGIHTTAYDMLRWANALLEGRVLNQESMKQYWAPHVDEGGGDSFYGYGWSVKDIGGTRVITHNGGNGIFMADMAIIPSSRTVLFMQTNVRTDSDDAPFILERMGARLLLGQPYPEVPQAVSLEPEKLERLAGNYTLADGGSLKVRASGGSLLVEAEGGGFTLLHSTEPSPDTETVNQLNAQIEGIVAAYVGGDFKPLCEAYQNQVTEEYLRSSYEQRLRRMEARMGPLQGFEVRGMARQGERDYSVVRFNYQRGHDDRAYVWVGGVLRGVSSRGLPEAIRFVPLGNLSFASWDAASGSSQNLAFAAGEDGRLRLRIGRGEKAVEAVRQGVRPGSVRSGKQAAPADLRLSARALFTSPAVKLDPTSLRLQAHAFAVSCYRREGLLSFLQRQCDRIFGLPSAAFVRRQATRWSPCWS